MINDFFATIYEIIYFQDFSPAMFSLGLYGPAGITTFLVVFLLVGLYYLPYGSPRFNKWFHWLGLCAIAALLSSVITQNRIIVTFARGGVSDYVSNEPYLWFFLWNFFLGFVLAFLYSLSIKYFSRNCSSTPF